jgi:hypothetical protein
MCLSVDDNDNGNCSFTTAKDLILAKEKNRRSVKEKGLGEVNRPEKTSSSKNVRVVPKIHRPLAGCLRKYSSFYVFVCIAILYIFFSPVSLIYIKTE